MPEAVTILAALIAAAISLVAITLSKEQKVSEFRQAWIDALGEDLTIFLSSARAFSRAMEARRIHGSESRDPAKTLFTLERIGEIRFAAVESFYRIKLRLNPEEPEHRDLLRLLWQAIVDQNAELQNESADRREVLAAIERAGDFAGPILKAEWKRVKQGERSYRVIRWSATVIVILSLLAVVMLWARPEHEAIRPPTFTSDPGCLPVVQEIKSMSDRRDWTS